MDRRYVIRAALLALSGVILFSVSSKAEMQPDSAYPLCKFWFKAPNEAALSRVQALLGSQTPSGSAPIDFQQDNGYKIATLSHCDETLGSRLEQSLRQSLAASTPAVEFKVVYVAGPGADLLPARAKPAGDSSIAQRLARAYHAAYGTLYQNSSRTGLYGDNGVGLEAATDLGYSAREVMRDPNVATRAGLAHYAYLLKRYQGNERKAALAYCAGAGRVEHGMTIPGQCGRFAAEFQKGATDLRDAPQAARRAALAPWRASSSAAETLPPREQLEDHRVALAPWRASPQTRVALVPWSASGPQAPSGPLGTIGEIGRQVFGFAGAVVLWPFDMARHIISGFGTPRDGGRRHMGVDIGAPIGTPIVAPSSGIVEARFGYAGISGYRMWLYHGKDQYGRAIETFYAHMNRSMPYADGIRPGVRVQQGQVIGYVGMTGNASSLPVSASHLHFQVRIDGVDVNPETVFSSRLLVKLR